MAEIQIKAVVTPVLNYALQQNRIPVLRELLIDNQSKSDIENAVVKLQCEPAFIDPADMTVALIPAGATYAVNSLQPQINTVFLAALTERMTGFLTITLESAQAETLAVYTCDMTALAFDEWHGTNIYPELLAAFVTPNHPEVTKIIARAAQLLGQWSGQPSLDAYQTQDANRVLMQAAAVYGALQELNIVYAVPPASFERIGQRVRLCDAVIQQKLGTCLDLTLLYAACLEAIGLRPLLLLQPGHIFAGVWLEDMSFAESVENDFSLITKRIADGVSEIAVVECTAFVSGKNVGFDEAKELAIRNLNGTEPLTYIIDVSRARLSGIRPLPLRVQNESGWTIEVTKRKENELTQVPGTLAEAIPVGESIGEKTWSKLAQWERKLLDLSLRNTLINLRWTQNVIPILSESLSDLEDALADGAEYGIGPRPAEWVLREEERHSMEQMADLGIYKELIQSEFKSKRLRSLLSEGELSRAIVNVYRSSKTSLEENGANTLYLALGFLRWFETSASQKARYAPLVLLPVEIVRKSALKGYVIRLRDEEPQMNITLLQMMAQDFGIQIQGLDPLPLDERGIDIRMVFTVIRKAVMDQPRWDVISTAFLGIFSFSQFVMWNDMRNRADALQQNKIVRSLMDGTLAWDAEAMEPGERVPEDDTLLPIPADASQLYAIREASAGKSFVLHGPPGTGKSQTITAIIANALAKGKSVLFVAEKMAALSVVQNRLKNIGVGPFCLELHSNKSNKREVLNQLSEAVQTARQEPPAAWQNRAEQTAILRRELDVYAQALHAAQPSGLSLFELIAAYTKVADCPEAIDFSRTFADSMDADLLQQQQRMTDRLIAAARLVGHPHGHPLRHVNRSSYTQSLRGELPALLSDYTDALRPLADTGGSLAQALARRVPVLFFDFQTLDEIARELQFWMPLPRAWGRDADFARTSLDIQKMAMHFSTAQSIHDELAAQWDEGFFNLDATLLKNEWAASEVKWFLPKALSQSALLKQLKPFWKMPEQKIPKESLAKLFATLADYRQNLDAGNALLGHFGTDLDNLYDGARTDWASIHVLAGNAKKSAETLADLAGNDTLRTDAAGVREYFTTINEYAAAFAKMHAAKDALNTLLELAEDNTPSGGWVQSQLAMCENIRTHADELKEWMIWTGTAKEAFTLGLAPLVSAYGAGLAHDTAAAAYRKGLYTALIHKTIEASPVLNNFSGAVFHEKIRQFQQLDTELAELAKQEVFCRLAAQVPNFTLEASQKSEVGVLQRAIRSGGRGVSIRRLFEQLSNLLPRLCPCMLMSPLSAAQYLDPNRKPFDLVIFDEASQMPTARAVGALARGVDAVIVGDPKQMPPTSFFSGNSLDEDNLEAEDLESVLDDALALNMPQSHLLWHYRSRHESLIAFSNHRFYENKLYTFPSINDRESKVDLVQVNGQFDRGKTRQNRAEAEAVIADLIRRSTDENCRNQSVGVVSFNIQQQNLIDDLFTDACKTNPALEQWAYEAAEPIFIKNLENVQGDERDAILFSIGYGPDATGKMYMNFGPLNREGGWRRLNVAVSRARQEMKVFASLQADQIDLSRTAAEGVAALRAFLEYAAKPALHENEQTLAGTGRGKEGIAKVLKRKLADAGYQAQTQVGHSKFRIDLAIIDPANPSRYLLGILLDGAGYHASKTTRDRELAQISVLRGLGWRIHRIWSVDWWDNSGKECAKVLEILQQAAMEPKPTPPPKLVPPVDTSVLSEAPKPLAAAAIESAPAQQVNQYSPAVLPIRTMTPDEFMQPQSAVLIRQAVQTVLTQEAPISEILLTRRVVQSFGLSRAGTRIQGKISLILRSMHLPCTVQSGQNIHWLPTQSPASYEGFRVSATGTRDVGDIPVQEIANAVCATLTRQIAMPKDDLLRETANALGYTRLGGNVIASISAGIACAVQTGRIAEQKDDYYAMV